MTHVTTDNLFSSTLRGASKPLSGSVSVAPPSVCSKIKCSQPV